MIPNFTRIVCPGTLDHAMFAKIEYTDGKLSISGAIGPKRNGDAYGSCGQFIMCFKEYDWRGHTTLADIAPNKNWTPELVKEFFDIWGRWHLNDMRAGSPDQEEFLRNNPINDALDHYTKACKALADAGLNPDPNYGNYKYGSQWLKEPVPDEILQKLMNLPTNLPYSPAWV